MQIFQQMNVKMPIHYTAPGFELVTIRLWVSSFNKLNQGF